MIFVCENNQYALNTAFHQTTSVPQIADRVSAYGVPGKTIDGNDAVEVYQVLGEAIARARRGEGPSLIEAMTWRWGPHSMRANLREPRTDAEMAAWKARDPLIRLQERMAAAQIPVAEIESIKAGIEREIEAAIAFGAQSPDPDSGYGRLRAASGAHRAQGWSARKASVESQGYAGDGEAFGGSPARANSR